MEEKSKLEEISKLLTEFLKVIKIVSVYPETNPLPAKLKESFSERFVDLIKEEEKLSFNIGRDKIFYRGEEVYEDRSDDDALADLFYRAGITEISFNTDFQYDQCGQFFRVMKAFINREAGSNDLVALFWQADLTGFNYRTLEDIYLREYDGEFKARIGSDDDDSFIRSGTGGFSESGRVQYASIFLDDEDESGDVITIDAGEEIPEGYVELPPGAVVVKDDDSIPGPAGMVPTVPQDLAESSMGLAPTPTNKVSVPDTSIILNEAFALSEADMARIEDILTKDAEFDMFSSTCLLLREMLGSQTKYEEFNELVIITEKLQTEFLRAGNLKSATGLLNNLKEIDNHLDKSKTRWKERIRDALIVSGGRERLNTLVVALNSNSEIESDDLINYLSVFGWEALSVITDLLGELEFRSHREALCDYLVKAGREYVDIISRGVFDRRWFVVRNSVSVLARIGGEKAFAYLEKALGHDDSRVRLQIIRGLQNNKDEKSVDILRRMVWDDDEIIRQTAIQSILSLADDVGFKIIAEMINDDRFASLSAASQEDFIIMFSRLGGEYAVGYLIKLISGWGLLKTQVQEFYRQVAFKALSQNRSERAEKELLRMTKSWRKKIRRMANAALTARREVVFGDK